MPMEILSLRQERRASVASLRPSPLISLLLSIILHSGGVLGIWVFSRTRFGFSEDLKPPRLTQASLKNRKLIWYRSPRDLPAIQPQNRIGKSPRPMGREKAPQAIIANSPKARNSKQFAWQMPDLPKVEKKLDSPNLIALSTVPNAPPPPPARRFVAPPERRTEPAPLRTLEEPTATSPVSLPIAQGQVDLKTPKAPARKFVAPAGRGSERSGSGNLEEPAATGSTLQVTAAIVSLKPTREWTGDLPETNSAARFSAAPTTGAPSSGRPGNGAQIPNLMVEGSRNATSGNTVEQASAAARKPATTAGRVYTYQKISPGGAGGTLSVPLRPGARRLPRSIEEIFRNRTAYTIVLPAPDLPAYGTDWTIWFAEKDPSGGEAVQMRAPLPRRKLERSDAAESVRNLQESWIQIRVIITRDGRTEPQQILKGGSIPARALMEEFSGWEFKPATRNGQPVEVEAILDVALKLAP